MPSLVQAFGEELADQLPRTDAGENIVFFLLPILGNQAADRLADHFIRRKSENPLRSRIPADDPAIEILRDNRIVGRLNQGSIMIERLHHSTSFDLPHKCRRRATAIFQSRCQANRNQREIKFLRSKADAL